MHSFSPKRSLAVVLLLATFAAAIGSVEPRLRREHKVLAERPVAAHPFSRYLVFGHGKGLAAYLWISLLSWYGGHVRQGKGSFALVTPADKAYVKQQLETAIELDPYFPDPYSFGVIVLSWYAKQPKEALYFCQAGHLQFPNDWTYPFYCGFVHYRFLKDEATATRYFLDAGKMPKVPSYVPLLASKFTRNRGDTRTALESMQALMLSPISPQLKEQIGYEIESLEMVLLIEESVAEFRRRHGRVPSEKDLVEEGLMEADPRDPMGNRIVIGPDGKVDIQMGANQ